MCTACIFQWSVQDADTNAVSVLRDLLITFCPHSGLFQDANNLSHYIQCISVFSIVSVFYSISLWSDQDSNLQSGITCSLLQVLALPTECHENFSKLSQYLSHSKCCWISASRLGGRSGMTPGKNCCVCHGTIEACVDTDLNCTTLVLSGASQIYLIVS